MDAAIGRNLPERALNGSSPKGRRHRNRSQKNDCKPGWDYRFHLDGMYNYSSLHPYYKVSPFNDCDNFVAILR